MQPEALESLLSNLDSATAQAAVARIAACAESAILLNVIKDSTSRIFELVQKMPELTTSLVAMMSDRIREGTRIEQQRDRLVSLGKLAAGLAHELKTIQPRRRHARPASWREC